MHSLLWSLLNNILLSDLMLWYSYINISVLGFSLVSTHTSHFETLLLGATGFCSVCCRGAFMCVCTCVCTYVCVSSPGQLILICSGLICVKSMEAECLQSSQKRSLSVSVLYSLIFWLHAGPVLYFLSVVQFLGDRDEGDFCASCCRKCDRSLSSWLQREE